MANHDVPSIAADIEQRRKNVFPLFIFVNIFTNKTKRNQYFLKDICTLRGTWEGIVIFHFYFRCYCVIFIALSFLRSPVESILLHI